MIKELAEDFVIGQVSMGAGSLVQDFTGNANLSRLASLTAGMATGTQSGKAFQAMDNAATGVKSLSHIDDVADVVRKVDSPVTKSGVGSVNNARTKRIYNDVLDNPRTGSALKVDQIRPIYEIDQKTGRPHIVQEFPAGVQAHGFNDIVDNYADYATKTPINNGMLYQLEGSLNGVPGRFEWIIQDGRVTHRMFIENGIMNGAPIKP